MRPASTRFVPGSTSTRRPSNRISGTRRLQLARARPRERAASLLHVVLEDPAEVLVQPLHRLRSTSGVRAERVRSDVPEQVVEQLQVAHRALAALDALQEVDAERQPVAARRAESARFAREESLQVE